MIEKRSARHGTQRFADDADSRLIEVRNPNGHVVRMNYDPLGRRIGKTRTRPTRPIAWPNGFNMGRPAPAATTAQQPEQPVRLHERHPRTPIPH
jgi:YD repeat-containing protein